MAGARLTGLETLPGNIWSWRYQQSPTNRTPPRETHQNMNRRVRYSFHCSAYMHPLPPPQQPSTLALAQLPRFVFILPSSLFQTFDVIPSHRRMQAVCERFIQLMRTNQRYHVGEVLKAAGGQLQFDEHSEIDNLPTFDCRANRFRVQKRDRAGPTAAGIATSDKKVDDYLIFSIREATRTPRNRLVVFGDEMLLKFGQSLRGKKNVHIVGCTPVAMQVDRHSAHQCIRDFGFLQVLDGPPQRLVDGIVLLKEHIDILDSIPNAEMSC